MDYIERSKRYIFNLQILANTINYYFFLKCKAVILLNRQARLPKHAYSNDGIVLVEKDEANFCDKMLFLDYDLLFTEFMLIEQSIFAEIISSLYKIFEEGRDKFSITESYIKYTVEYRNNIPFTTDIKKEGFNNVGVEIINRRREILKEIGEYRNKVISHHNNKIFEKNFLSGQRRYFDNEHHQDYNLDFQKVFEIINAVIDWFVDVNQLTYLHLPDSDISFLDFASFRFCRIYINRNTSGPRKINSNALINLKKELNIIVPKLERLFCIKNSVIRNDGDKIFGKMQFQNLAKKNQDGIKNNTSE